MLGTPIENLTPSPVLEHKLLNEMVPASSASTEGFDAGVGMNSIDPIITPPPRRVAYRHQSYLDIPPEGPGPIIPPNPPNETNSVDSVVLQAAEQIRTFTFRIPPAIYATVVNYFGLYREYFGKIETLPDRLRGLAGMTSRTTQFADVASDNHGFPAASRSNRYGPCRNKSIFAFKYWWWVLGGEKTNKGQLQLVDLLRWDKFDKEEMEGVDMMAIDRALGQPLPPERGKQPLGSSGWTEHTVKIAIPMPKMANNFDPHANSSSSLQQNASSIPQTLGQLDPDRLTDTSVDPPLNIFSVPGLLVRSLSTVIQETLQQPSAKWFHWKPFCQFWKPNPNSPSQRVYDELYSSPVWIAADKEVQELDIPHCNLPRAIAGLMFWSDSTCVSEFGTRSLWPIYMFFGNQSKYDRSKPSNNAGHQVAFLPSVIWTCLFCSLLRTDSFSDPRCYSGLCSQSVRKVGIERFACVL
jgi:Plavaka transposase